MQVHAKDPATVARKRALILAGGAANLQVITDFDFTITKFWVDGVRGFSSHLILEKCPELSQDYITYARNLHAQYHPIEMSPTLSVEEKIPHMIEWWTKSHNALILADVKKELFSHAVAEAHVAVRDGAGQLFSLCQSKNVQVFVFSAGLYQIIEEVFRAFLPDALQHVKLVANDMVFDESGKLVAFGPQLLHTFNKTFGSLPDMENYINRRNVIVIGDSFGDVHMADGYNCDNCLRVGFLNNPDPLSLAKYMDVYDVVLTGDPDLKLDASFDYVNQILQSLA